MGLFRFLAIILFIGALPIALIATNIRFAASEPRVYDYAVREYGASEVSGIPEDELIRANRQLVRYLTGRSQGPLSITVEDRAGNQTSLFNARETAHLADVRGLFQVLFAAQQVAVAALLVAAVILLVSAPLRALAAAALASALVTIATIGAVAIVAMLGFEAFWTRFHLLAFTNDLWRLDPSSDHLIQMFPEPFWQDIVLLVGAFTLLEAVLLALISGLYLLFTRRAAALPPQPELPRPAIPLRPSVPQPRPRIPPPHPRHFPR